MNQEMDAIASMLECAKKYGLEVEVVAAFGAARETGDSVEQAVIYALYEWDL